MKRTAIISDIHSNWVALQAVWQRIEELECDRVFCLGDVVGYGPRPVECLDFIRKNTDFCIQGNHDALVGDGSRDLQFNELSLVAVRHNRDLLDAEQLNYLATLPTLLEPDPGTFLSHGSPDNRDRYLIYRQDLQQVSGSLMDRSGPGVCFFGHTHHPMAFSGEIVLPREEPVVAVNAQEMMLFNPGSVGQPRDGNPGAAFLYWDHEKGTIHFERVSYDVQAVRQEILDMGLPPRLGDRLLEGR